MTDTPVAQSAREYVSDKTVLLVISGGLIAILLAIIIGLLRAKSELPNWAENVFVSIATASALKLGDCLATLVALSTGRQTERLSNKLADAPPVLSSSGTTTTTTVVEPAKPSEPQEVVVVNPSDAPAQVEHVGKEDRQ